MSKFIFPLLFLLLISVLVFVSLYKPSTPQRTPQKSVISQEVAQELPPQAYEKFKTDYLKLLNTDNSRVVLAKLQEQTKTNPSLLRSCHALTHEIGRAAYRKYNDFGRAMQYQDEMCNSGYLHGIIEAHFSAVKDISQVMQTTCTAYPASSFIGWECYHGIGHGLMYANDNNLPLSVVSCGYITDPGAASSCVNGVFMENFNTDQKNHYSKYLSKTDALYPCPQQTVQNKFYCYFYAPTYYLHLHRNAYTQALAWCRTVEDGYQSFCIQGVGSQAIKENITHPKLAEKICMATERSETNACISGMVSLYVNHFGSTVPAQKLCPQLEAANKKTCESVVSSFVKTYHI